LEEKEKLIREREILLKEIRVLLETASVAELRFLYGYLRA